MSDTQGEHREERQDEAAGDARRDPLDVLVPEECSWEVGGETLTLRRLNLRQTKQLTRAIANLVGAVMREAGTEEFEALQAAVGGDSGQTAGDVVTAALGG